MGHSEQRPHARSARARLCQAPSPSLERSRGTPSARKAQSLGAIFGKATVQWSNQQQTGAVRPEDSFVFKGEKYFSLFVVT